MPNSGLSEDTIAQTIGAVERALREGYPPPREARRVLGLSASLNKEIESKKFGVFRM